MKTTEMLARSTYENLSAQGYAPEQELKSRSMVVVSEKGKRYALKTEAGEPSVVYSVDGNIIADGQKCDKLILVKLTSDSLPVEHWAEVFVELKGVDVHHAVSQLRETLKQGIFRHKTNLDVRARIVAQSFPSNKSNPAMERAKREFRRDFNCDLRGMKTGQTEIL